MNKKTEATKEGPKSVMDIPWEKILVDAVKNPGRMMEAYRAFHNYSLRNAMMVFFECLNRGIKPGPVTTYKKWKEKGRHVRKGEKALTMMMPLIFKAKKEEAKPEAVADGGEIERSGPDAVCLPASLVRYQPDRRPRRCTDRAGSRLGQREGAPVARCRRDTV